MKIPLVLIQVWFTSFMTANRINWQKHNTFQHLPPHKYQRTRRQETQFGGVLVSDITESPFTVRIKIQQQEDCCGGLLTTSFVITACHCLAAVPVNESGPAVPLDTLKLHIYQFIAGTRNIRNLEETAQVREAQSLHFHPKCANKGAIVYDLGLAKMLTPFFETPYVRPLKMCTWSKDEFLSELLEYLHSEHKPQCTVAGWRDTRTGDIEEIDTADRLKITQIYAVRDEVCLGSYVEMMPEKYHNFNFSNYGQQCAASDTVDSSDCVGDPGSPHICQGYIIGVVSNGTSCNRAHPSIFQTVSVLMDWVKNEFAGQINTTGSNFTGCISSISIQRSAKQGGYCVGYERNYEGNFYDLPQVEDETETPLQAESTQHRLLRSVFLMVLMRYAL